MLVLHAFTRETSWGVRALAAELGVAKSGLHRTLQHLAQEGLLTVDQSGAYSVAHGLLYLASGLMEAVDLTRVAYPHLQAARDTGSETVVLVAYDPQRQQITGVAAAETNNPIKYAWRALQGWTDLHLSASGKGILAFLDPAAVDEILARPLATSDGTPMDREALRRELRTIQRRGWSATCGERIPGGCGVCAPVRDARGRVVGGVVIAWPDYRERRSSELQESLGRLCRDTATAISHDLGAGDHASVVGMAGEQTRRSV